MSAETETYPSFPTVEMFGLSISSMDMDATVEYLVCAVSSGKPHQVVTINPIMIMDGLANPERMKVFREAELLVPDGAGVVWAASRLGTPVAERVPGIELMHRLLEEADRRHWRIYLLGASEDVIVAARDRLKQKYPGALFAGYHHGFFTEEEDEQIVEHIRAAKPHLLFMASSTDKQEPWISRYREALGVPVVMGVGGSFDIAAGKLKRAPQWMRRMRIEWLYRLIQEPSRYKRMLALPKFMAVVRREARRKR